MATENENREWSTVIRPQYSLFAIDFKEIWRYRDLAFMMIKRDVITYYKQTILGPIWLFVQPIMTTAMYMLVFGSIAKISTDGLPQPLFYLSGICMWQYFADCMGKTSSTFTANAGIFGKVYFPRLIVPIANVLGNLVRMGIQLTLFLIVYCYYLFYTDAGVRPNAVGLLFPALVALMAGLALGFGILFSSFTTKYRDLRFLLGFFVQLWMYATPVIYPLSTVTDPRLKFVMKLNPLTGILEAFKYGVLGTGDFSWNALGYSAVFAAVLMAIGILVFNRVQRSFIDTV